MAHDLPFAMSVITTALNVAGIFSSVYLWVSLRAGVRLRAAWLLPVFVTCAVLEAAFVTHRIWLGQDPGVGLSDIARRSGLDLVIWPLIGLSGYHLCRYFAKRRASDLPSSPRNSAGEPAEATPPSLKAAINRFVAAADGGEVTEIAATYAVDFTCVRVADDGGFALLSGQQMLAFWGNPLTAAAGKKHALPTRATAIHHTETWGDTGLALLTRIKDFGHGWEPVFYTLLWRFENKRWRLTRELVHQRSVPDRL